MAWQKSTWNNVIGTSGSKVTVNAGNSTSGIINTNLATPLKFLDLTIRCLVDFGGTPDGNAEIVVYGRDFLGSNIADTVPVYRQDIESVVSDKQIITLPNIDVSSLDSFNIVVMNKDTLDPIDVWVSFMYGYIDEASVAGPDEKVKVSYNDTTPDYLENKLDGEVGVIDVTVQNEGADESLKISLDSTKLSNWDAAYGWGDHALAGYLTVESDPVFSAWLAYPPSLSEFIDDVGYLTVESDPVFGLWLSGVTPANWDAAYGWGDHALAGYLTAETDPVFSAWLAYPPGLSEFTNDVGYLTAESDPVFSAWLTYPPSLSEFTNDVGYLTAETDPVFGLWLSGVTPANWDTAYGWGDHALAGYLTVESDPVFSAWLAYPPGLSEFTNDIGYLTAETDPVFSAWLAYPPSLSEFTNDLGYLTAETDPIFSAWLAYPPAVSEFTNDAGYLTVETDPVFEAWLTYPPALSEFTNDVGYLTAETDPVAMAVFLGMKDPTGFVDRTSSELSFSDVNLRLSLAVKSPATEFKYYINGVLYTKNTTQTADITDTEGLWFFYFNGATLTAVQGSFPGFDKVIVAIIYWNATSNTAIFIGDERHGCGMDYVTHGYLHQTIGARFSSGLGITINVAGDGDTDSHAQLALDNGDIYDEDILVEIRDGASGLFVQDLTPIAQIPVFWRSGANGDWKKDAATDYPMKQGTDRIQYNLFSVGTWSATDITVNGRYAVMWILATNEIDNPVIAILGQGDYSNLAAAQAASYTELSLGTLPTKETKLLYKLIIQTSSTYTNVPSARFREVTDFRQTTTGPVGTPVITNHNSLSGRSDASAHPATSIDTTVTNFSNILSSSDDTVQKALDTIDNYYPEKHFRAEDLRNPNSADWAVNSLADLGADGSNNGIDSRFFDDTTNEGVGFSMFVPSYATNIILRFISRAATAPAGTKKVDLGLYFRGVPDNGAVAAWSAKKDIADLISIPTNAYYQYDTVTLSLATLGITVNQLTHFELIRDAADTGNDDLVGDWLLTSLRVSFS